MNKILIARFHYVDPRTLNEFTVDRAWPCQDQCDAELIAKYHASKTGAYQVKLKLEDIEHEEVK